MRLKAYIWSTTSRDRARNFCLGGQVAALIYLLRQPLHSHTHTHTHTHIYTFFYLISYIYIHTHSTNIKKSLVFSIKIMFDGNLS